MAEQRVKKPKKFLGPVITAAVLVVLFIVSGIYYYRHTIINDGEIVNTRASLLTFQIDEAEAVDDQLQIRGWCFAQGEDTTGTLPAMRVVLIDAHGTAMRKYLTADYGQARPEVAAYFDGPCDYTNCGFTASIDLDELYTDHNDYQIVLQHDAHKKDLVETGIYFTKGQMHVLDPEQVKAPDVEGTDLEDIVTNGVIREDLSGAGMYIYQKDWKIYMLFDKQSSLAMEVLDENYHDFYAMPPADDGDYTSAKTSDPQDDPWDLSGNLQDYEITDTMDAGHYRVVCREIPTEYPVAWIEIGLYKKGREILVYPGFIPWYDFGE